MVSGDLESLLALSGCEDVELSISTPIFFAWSGSRGMLGIDKTGDSALFLNLGLTI